MTKALFIPLRTEWFQKYQKGTKTTEYRVYGSRWNERTCFIGRHVVISHGYGKRERLRRIVRSFKVLDIRQAPKAVQEIYPDATRIAAIGLR